MANEQSPSALTQAGGNDLDSWRSTPPQPIQTNPLDSFLPANPPPLDLDSWRVQPTPDVDVVAEAEGEEPSWLRKIGESMFADNTPLGFAVNWHLGVPRAVLDKEMRPALGQAFDNATEKVKAGFMLASLDALKADPNLGVELPGTAGIGGMNYYAPDMQAIMEEVQPKIQEEQDRILESVLLMDKALQEKLPADMDMGEKMALGVVGSAPSLAASVGAMLATRNPYVAASLAGGMTFGTSQAEAGAAGKTPGERWAKALIDTGVEVGFSAMPLKRLGEVLDASMTGSPEAVKAAVNSVVSEMTSEQAITAANTATNLMFDMDQELAQATSWEEALKIQAERQLLAAGVSGLMSGAVSFGIAGIGATAPRLDRVDKESAPVEPPSPTPKEFVGPLITDQLIQEMELAKPVQERFDRVVDRTTGGLEDFVDIDPSTAGSLVELQTQQSLLDEVVYFNGEWVAAPKAMADDASKGRVMVTLPKDWWAARQEWEDAGEVEKVKNFDAHLKPAMEFLEKSAPWVEKWVDFLMPGQRIVLKLKDPQSQGSWLGAHLGGKDLSVIQLDPLQQRDGWNEMLGFSTLSHEFGHAFILKKWADLGPKAKAALELEYKAWRDSVLRPKAVVRDVLANFKSAAEAMEGRFSDMLLTRVEDLTSQQREFLEKMLTRNEFFAQQMAKYQTYSPKAAKVARPFFTSIVAQLRRWNKAFGKQYAPTQTFEAWVDSLVATRRVEKLAETERVRTEAAWKEVEDAPPGSLSPLELPIARELEAEFRFKEWEKVYGRTMPLDKAIPGMKLKMTPGVKQVDDASREMNGFKRGFLTLLQIAKRNSHIPGVMTPTTTGSPGFITTWREMIAWRRGENVKRNEILQAWRKLGKAQATKVGEFAMAVSEMSREQGMRLTPAQLAREARLMGLTEQAFKVWESIDKEFQFKLVQLKDAMLSAANTRGMEAADLADYRRQVERQFVGMENAHYFPASRMGDHIVKVTAASDGSYKGRFFQKGDTLIQEHFHSKAEADAAAAALRKQNIGVQHVVGRDVVAKGAYRSFQGLPPAMLNELLKRLPEEYHQDIRNAIASAGPGKGFAKRLVKNNGVAGASKAYRASILSYFESFDTHLARIKYDPMFTEAVRDVARSADDKVMQGEDASVRRKLQEYMNSSKEYVMNPGREFKVWGAIAFDYFLLGVGKHAMLALYQLPSVAFPALSTRYGSLPAMAEMKRAIRQVVNKKFEPTKLHPELQLALAEAERRETLSSTYSREVAALAQARNLERLIPGGTHIGEGVSNTWNAFLQVAAAMNHGAELFARNITFIAAWNLEYSQNQDSVRAFQMAEHAVEESHFNYQSSNVPAAFRNSMRPLYVFQSHVQGMLEFLFGNNPAKWRGFAALVLASGLTGLPFAENVEDIADWALKKYNSATGNYSTPPLSKLKLRQEMQDLLEHATDGESAKLITDLALDGAGKWGFGLGFVDDAAGWNLGSFDITPSISLGRIIPGTEALNKDTWAEKFTAAGEGIAGPGFAVPLGMMQAAVESQATDTWRLGKFLPNMFSNPMQAAEWERTGEITDRFGRKLLEFNPDDPKHKAELFWQAMGVPSTRLQLEREKRWAAARTVEYYTTTRAVLGKQLYEAVKSGEQQAVSDVLQSIRDYNSTIPHPGFSIDGRGLVRSLEQRFTDAKKFEQAIPGRMGDIPATREIMDTFPESP